MPTAIEFDPSLIALMTLFQNLGVTAPAATPSAPSQPSPQLQAFLQSIPFANDGDVITADHHNTLREAIGAIARAIDESQFARVVTVSLTPVFQAQMLPTPRPSWRTQAGEAIGPAEGPLALGWMPVSLPEGTNIDTMTIRGAGPTLGTDEVVAVVLSRRELAGDDSNEIVVAEVTKDTPLSGGKYVVAKAPKREGLTPAQAAELKRVDNTKYRYFVTGSIDAANASQVVLSLIQITCTRS